MKDLKLGTKMGIGFGLLLVVMTGLGGVASLTMNQSAKSSNSMAQAYMPELKGAVQLERDVMNVMYDARGYAYSRNEKFLNSARQRIAAARQALSAASALANEKEELSNLRPRLQQASKALDTYEAKLNETETTIKAMQGEIVHMATAAANLQEAANGYIGLQEVKLKDQINKYDTRDRLKDRSFKIKSGHEFLHMVNEVRVGNFKSMLLGDKALSQKTLDAFPKIEERLEELFAVSKIPEFRAQLFKVQAGAREYKTAVERYRAAEDALEP